MPVASLDMTEYRILKEQGAAYEKTLNANLSRIRLETATYESVSSVLDTFQGWQSILMDVAFAFQEMAATDPAYMPLANDLAAINDRLAPKANDMMRWLGYDQGIFAHIGRVVPDALDPRAAIGAAVDVVEGVTDTVKDAVGGVIGEVTGTAKVVIVVVFITAVGLATLAILKG